MEKDKFIKTIENKKITYKCEECGHVTTSIKQYGCKICNRNSRNKDIIEKEYIGFKVINIFYDSTKPLTKRRYANCICDCGEKIIIRGDQLSKRRGCKKCGCAFGGKKRVYPDNESGKKLVFNSYKKNSIVRNLTFDISREQFDILIAGNCYYCGDTPRLCTYSSKAALKYKDLYINGIDRLDNNIGYIIDNCVPCCTTCNMMKKTMSDKVFLEHIKKINKYQENK